MSEGGYVNDACRVRLQVIVATGASEALGEASLRPLRPGTARR
jgi:hypothetical protein